VSDSAADFTVRRTIKYLSPSSVQQFYKDREEFYLMRISPIPPPKYPQTKPMAVGSAFDAFVKNYLVRCLHGSVPPEFELDTLIETQVEEHNRPWAREHGYHVFTQYKYSGALARIMLELQAASSTPRFEFTVEKRVAHEADPIGVPLLGKPDVFFRSRGGAPVILDWKVNGYCSKNPTSARTGYVHYLDGWDHSKRPASKNHGQSHRSCYASTVDGLVINLGAPLENVYEDWARQLSIYLWVLGEPIGSQAIVGIDQLLGQAAVGQSVDLITDHQSINPPDIGIAQHRCRISVAYQRQWMALIAGAWACISSGHIFDDLTRADSDAKCSMLDDQWQAFAEKLPADNKNQEWYNRIMGRSN